MEVKKIIAAGAVLYCLTRLKKVVITTTGANFSGFDPFGAPYLFSFNPGAIIGPVVGRDKLPAKWINNPAVMKQFNISTVFYLLPNGEPEAVTEAVSDLYTIKYRFV